SPSPFRARAARAARPEAFFLPPRLTSKKGVGITPAPFLCARLLRAPGLRVGLARPALGDQPARLVERNRTREQIALAEAQPEVAERGELAFGLDPLGDHVEVEARAQIDDRADDREVVAARGERAHEGLVDLERVDRKLAEMDQRGIAG